MAPEGGGSPGCKYIAQVRKKETKEKRRPRKESSSPGRALEGTERDQSGSLTLQAGARPRVQGYNRYGMKGDLQDNTSLNQRLGRPSILCLNPLLGVTKYVWLFVTF